MQILKKITQEKIQHQNGASLVGQSLIKYDPYPYKDLASINFLILCQKSLILGGTPLILTFSIFCSHLLILRRQFSLPH